MGLNEVVSDVSFTSDGEQSKDDSLRTELDVTSEAALVRKIDLRIIPTLFLAYFLQFLDKVIINVRSCYNAMIKQANEYQYANVMGLQKDLNMQGQDFSWTATAFFIGYIIAELPQGKTCTRVIKIRKLMEVVQEYSFNDTPSPKFSVITSYYGALFSAAQPHARTPHR